MAPRTIQLRGVKDLERVLRQLPARSRRRVVKNGLRSGARVLAKEIEHNAPTKTGDLSNAVTVRTSARSAARGRFEAGVVVRPPEYRLVHLLEFGTDPHTIRTKRSRVLADGTTVFGTEVQHPGTPAQPFVRPAIDMKGNAAIQKMGDIWGRGVAREAKKLAGPTTAGQRRRLFGR